MLRLHLVRHADPDYAGDTISAPGHREAEALARRLAEWGIERLDCSTLGRARDTAAYTARRTGIEPVFHDALREFDWHTELSGWGRLSAWDVPGEAIRAGDTPRDGIVGRFVSPFSAEIEALHRFSDRYLAGFGYQRVGDRYRLDRPVRKRVAVVCHGGVGLTWLAHLLALPLPMTWCGFWLAPCSITTIVFEERSTRWAVPRCTGLGDVGHLCAAGLPRSNSGFLGKAEP